MKFKDFLNEMAPLGQEHEERFKKIGKEIKYKDRYKELFGKEDRIYIKVSGSIEPKFNKDLYDEIIDRAYDYAEHLTYNSEFEYSVVQPFDFKKTGIVKFKQGKVIKNIKVEDILKKIEYKLDREKYLNMWKYTPKKDIYNNLSVVISRNPCDIAGMSTNRGWKSCMNLYTGEYREFVKKDVIYGTLVVYLIDSKDKDIIYPFGRKLIKPYISKDKKIYLELTKPTYGNKFPNSAIEEIKNWLKEYQKNVEGYFEKNPKLYDDTGEEDVYIGKKIKFNVGDKVKIKKEFLKDFNYLRFDGVVTNAKPPVHHKEKLGVKFPGYVSGYDLNSHLRGLNRYSGRWVHPYKLEKIEKEQPK